MSPACHPRHVALAKAILQNEIWQVSVVRLVYAFLCSRFDAIALVTGRGHVVRIVDHLRCMGRPC